MVRRGDLLARGERQEKTAQLPPPYVGVHESQLLEVGADNTDLWAPPWAQLDLASGADLPVWGPGSCPVNIQVVSREVEILARSKV